MGIKDLFEWCIRNDCEVRFHHKTKGQTHVTVMFDDRSGARMAIDYIFPSEDIMNHAFPVAFSQVFERIEEEIDRARKAE